MKLKKAPAFLLFIIAIVLSGTELKAQVRDDLDTPEARAKKLTDKMKDRLPLADSVQYQSVYQVNLKYARKMKESLESAGSRMAKFQAMKTVQKEKNKEIKTILNKEQYKNYEQMMDEMKKQMKDSYRNR